MATYLERDLKAILNEKATKLKPENLKKGVTAFGITGTMESGIDTSDATATANDLLNPKTAYVNGQKITGNIMDLNSLQAGDNPRIADSSTIDGNPAIKISAETSNSKPAKIDAGDTLSIRMTYAPIVEYGGITPDKITKGNTIYGIEGTAEGPSITVEGIKQFSTIEEMQADPTAKEGDLAVVYRSEVKNATADSQFQVATFPDTVVLDTALTDYVEVRYRAVDSSKMFDCWGQLDSSMFMMNCYTESGEVRIQYESSDGITYTRTDTTGNPVDFGTEIYYKMAEMWNDAIGKFIQIGGMYFDGLFKYGWKTSDNHIVGKDISTWSTKNLNDCSDVIIDISEIKSLLSERTSDNNYMMFYIQTYTQNNFRGLNVIKPTKWFTVQNHNVNGGQAFSIGPYNYNDATKIVISRGSTTATDSYAKVEFFDGVNLVETRMLDQAYGATDWQATYVLYKDNTYLFPETENPVFAFGNDYLRYSTVLYWNGSSTSWTETGFTSTNASLPQYNVAPTQLSATSDYVYEKEFYGQNGVETGALGTPDNSFADTNAEVYIKIQNQYENMEPRILTDDDKIIDKNICFIPVNKAGTVLLDTSSVTNMNSMFSNCANLTTIPLLDTSNVTDMSYMFDDCKNLITIPQLDASKVTNMYRMFTGCTNLTIIPLLDTSNVTDMFCMFSGCTNLTEIPELNTSKVTMMNSTFGNCANLTTIPLLDTSNVTNTYGMFYGCTNLTEIPLLNTSKVTHMQNMFTNCPNLSDESLNNILAMCINATSYTKTKTLAYIGLTSEQATKCTTLSNYSAFTAAGWTTGY